MLLVRSRRAEWGIHLLPHMIPLLSLIIRYTPQLNFSAIPDDDTTDWAKVFGSVPKGAKTGKENGFSVLFDIESFDYGYYDEGSEGLKVKDARSTIRP